MNERMCMFIDGKSFVFLDVDAAKRAETVIINSIF